MDSEEIALTSFIIRRQSIDMVEDFWNESVGVINTVRPIIIKSFTIPNDKYGSHYWVSGFTTIEGSHVVANNAYSSDPVAPLSFYDFLGAPYDYSTVQAYKISHLLLTMEEVTNFDKIYNRDELLGKLYTVAVGSIGERGRPVTLTMLVYQTLDSLHNIVLDFLTMQE